MYHIDTKHNFFLLIQRAKYTDRVFLGVNFALQLFKSRLYKRGHEIHITDYSLLENNT